MTIITNNNFKLFHVNLKEKKSKYSYVCDLFFLKQIFRSWFLLMNTKAANIIRGTIKKKNTRSPSLNAVFFSKEKNFTLMIIKLEVNSY